MTYPFLHILHLLVAIAFVGTVFFEVVMLEGVRKHLPSDLRREVGRLLGNRAVAIMPWVIATLFMTGAGLAWRHRWALAQPMTTSFGLLLTIKIVLALSVLGHFVTAMVWRRRGLLRGSRSRRLHLSVLTHVLLIVLLAKAMFYLHW